MHRIRKRINSFNASAVLSLLISSYLNNESYDSFALFHESFVVILATT